MPSLRKEREATVATLTKDLSDIQGLVVAGYVGVKTPELNELRDKLRPVKGRCSVVKNTLAKIALKNAGLSGNGFADFFDGQSALIFQKGDAVASLKVLVDFAKGHANFKIRAGHMNGKVMQPAEIKAMASLPGKPQLLAMLLGALQGPLRGLHGAASAHLRNLHNVLSRLAEKKGAAGAK